MGQKFKLVPGMKDAFFYCPSGLELGDHVQMPRVGSSRQRNETKSSGSTSRHLVADCTRPDEDDDKTIEFRSVSHESLRFNHNKAGVYNIYTNKHIIDFIWARARKKGGGKGR